MEFEEAIHRKALRRLVAEEYHVLHKVYAQRVVDSEPRSLQVVYACRACGAKVTYGIADGGGFPISWGPMNYATNSPCRSSQRDLW